MGDLVERTFQRRPRDAMAAMFLVDVEAVGISASGAVFVATARSSQPPGGSPSCKPAIAYAGSSPQFPAPYLPCWSLIAHIGGGQPFEVGTSILAAATSGRLYLGINADSFSHNAGFWAVKIKIGGLP